MAPEAGDHLSPPPVLASLDRLPLRADVVDLLRRAGVEFFRIPVAPEGDAMRSYFHSPAYIHCHFTPDWVAMEGSALTLLRVFLQRVHPEDRAHMSAVADLLLRSEGYSRDITSNRFRGVSETGQWCWYEVRLSVRREGELRICEGLIINVDEQEGARRQLEQQAFEDRLTGLGNLAASITSLQRLLQQAAAKPGCREAGGAHPEGPHHEGPQHEGSHPEGSHPEGSHPEGVHPGGADPGAADPISLIWLDLTGFGRINALMGRAKGDALLMTTARILTDWIQEGDQIFRPNSDEFLVLLPGRDCEAARAAAVHLNDLLPRRLQGLSELRQGLRFKAGIAAYPEHGRDAEGLLSCAAAALDQACRPGSEAVVVYSEAITDAARQVVALEQELEQAIAGGQLRLVFQPQVDARGDLVGCEALLRWQSPVLGTVSPGRFIPVAEQTGQIHALGIWVIEEACRWLARWREAGLAPPPLGINISAVQLTGAGPSLAVHLLRSLNLHRLEPAAVHVEITESGALEERGIRQLLAIHGAGVALHVDDFGTGFASLSGLLRLPIHTLKLDQSFVRQMDVSDASEAILRASHALAASIGANALVEGVEQQWQVDRLRAMGFSRFQGYLFSPPLEAAAFAELLRDPVALRSRGPTP